MQVHHHIIHHVRRHHKKYLFCAGAAIGFGIVKIIAIASVFLGITLMTGKSNAAEEKGEMYGVLDTFNQIDNIAHNEINEPAKENPFDEEGKRAFYKIDEEFHNATNLTEKFRASKKMVDLLTQQELHHPVLGDDDSDIERDEKYRELLDRFHKLY